MANWMFKMVLKDFYHSRTLSIWEKAKKVAERISQTFPKEWLDPDAFEYDSELDLIRDNFMLLDTSLSVEQATEEFDAFMEELYDYADAEVPPLGRFPRNALCWISTK